MDQVPIEYYIWGQNSAATKILYVGEMRKLSTEMEKQQ